MKKFGRLIPPFGRILDLRLLSRGLGLDELISVSGKYLLVTKAVDIAQTTKINAQLACIQLTTSPQWRRIMTVSSLRVGAGISGRVLTGRMTLSADETASPPTPLLANDIPSTDQHDNSIATPVNESFDGLASTVVAPSLSASSEGHPGSSDDIVDVSLLKLLAEAAEQSAITQMHVAKAAYDKGLCKGERRNGLQDARVCAEGYQHAIVEANERYQSAVADVSTKVYATGYAKGRHDQKEDEKVAISAALQEGEIKKSELEAKVEFLRQTLRKVGTERLEARAELERQRAKQKDLLSALHHQPKKVKASWTRRRQVLSQNVTPASALARELRNSQKRCRRLQSQLVAGGQQDQRVQLLNDQLAMAAQELQRFAEELSASRNAQLELQSSAERQGEELNTASVQLAEQQETNRRLVNEGQQAVAFTESQAVTIHRLEQEREEVNRRYHEEMQALRNQLATANQTSAMAQQELTVNQDVLGFTTQRVRQQDEQLRTGGAQLAQLERTIRILENDAQRAATHAETQASTIRDLEQERDGMRRQAAGLREENETVRAERDALSAAVSSSARAEAAPAPETQVDQPVAVPRAVSEELDVAPQDQLV